MGMIRIVRCTNAERIAYGGIEEGRIFFCTDTNKAWIGTAGGDLEFGAGDFLSMPDTPASYAGSKLKLLRVNAAESALEFADSEESTKYYDDFADASRHWTWIDTPGNGSITESGSVVTLAVAGGVNGDWVSGNQNMPRCMTGPMSCTLEIITKMNTWTVNNLVGAGIYICSIEAWNDGIQYRRLRNDGGGKNGLQVSELGVGELDLNAVTTLPIWLRARIIGGGTHNEIDFAYSTDGITYTHQYTHTVGEIVYLIGIFASNFAATYSAISVPFEFFQQNQVRGPF